MRGKHQTVFRLFAFRIKAGPAQAHKTIAQMSIVAQGVGQYNVFHSILLSSTIRGNPKNLFYFIFY